MARRCAFLTCSCVVALVCAGGCGDHPQFAVYPVKGRLMVGNKPAAGASLAFHAIDPRIVCRPVAQTGPDGTFRLMTYAVDDGAPTGEYVVTIFWRDDSPADQCEGYDLIKHDRLFGVYFDRTKSPLRATVQPGSNDLAIDAVDPREILKSMKTADRPESR